jgi:hypothetical protein
VDNLNGISYLNIHSLEKVPILFFSHHFAAKKIIRNRFFIIVNEMENV